MITLKEKIKQFGKVGSTKTERYIDLPDGMNFTLDTDKPDSPIRSAAQLVYFGDDNKVLVYVLNEFDFGETLGEFWELYDLPVIVLRTILLYVKKLK